jgi:hypothetical protein
MERKEEEGKESSTVAASPDNEDGSGTGQGEEMANVGKGYRVEGRGWVADGRGREDDSGERLRRTGRAATGDAIHEEEFRGGVLEICRRRVVERSVSRGCDGTGRAQRHRRCNDRIIMPMWCWYVAHSRNEDEALSPQPPLDCAATPAAILLLRSDNLSLDGRAVYSTAGSREDALSNAPVTSRRRAEMENGDAMVSC